MEANKLLLDDCKSGWLMVEKDFSTRLFKQEQLKYALQCMGRNPSDKVVSRYWTQCGGSMSYEQFCLVMKRERKTTMRDLMSSFRKIDLNGDGYITAEELHKVLTKRGEKMSHDEVQAIIDEADENGDGKLDYAEFSHMLLNTTEECVSAAKQKASQASKTSSRKKGTPSKRRMSQREGSCRTSSDLQRQREDVRAQLFPQGGQLTLQNAQLHRNERPLPPNPPSQEPVGMDSNLPTLHTQESAPLTETTPDTQTEPSPVTSTESKHTDQAAVVENGVPVKEPPKSLPDPLEHRSSSLTKLPPLKNKPLPPIQPDPPKESQEENSQEIESKQVVETNTSSPPPEQQSSEPVAKDNESLKSNSQTNVTTPTSSTEAEESQSPAGDTVKPASSAATEQTEPAETSPKTPTLKPAESVDEFRDTDRQTDHLPNEEEPKKKEVSPPASVFTPPPKKPKNLQSWNSITGKGCFYLDTDEAPPPDSEDGDVIRCHHYRLKLTSPTNVWIEVGVAKPGNLATDTLLFVFHTDESEEPTELIAYTQHRVGERWVCRLDLDAGTYALIPFTSRCYLKPREDEGEVGVALLSEEGGRVSLSEECQVAFEEVFHRMDLDGNGFISRTEFDFFQERTSGDICDDEAWKVIQDNFEMTGDDELTLQGFLDLHVMTAEDEEGGEAEVREVIQALGYNNHLQLDQACPFVFDVYTEDNEGEIEIVDLLPSAPHTDPALCQLVRERGVCEAVRDGKGELDTYTFTTPHMTTIVVENKSAKNASVQLDCSQSTNCVFSRDSPLHVLTVPANSTVIGFHIQPLAATEPYKIDCIASKILC